MRNQISRCLLIASLCYPAFGMAQSSEDWQSLVPLKACYNAAKAHAQKTACIYSVSKACQEKTEGGYSTIGMMQCNQSETAAWDTLLNEEYAATMRDFKLKDVDDKTYNSDLSKETTRTYTLKQAQRAWIVFRDAECASDYAMWGMGSMRMIAGSACMLDMTAQRTIELWDKRGRMR